MNNRSQNILILVLTAVLTFVSCQFLENNEKQAVDICKRSKIQVSTDNAWESLGLSIGLSMFGLSTDATWIDFANMIAKQDSNTKFDWSAQKTEEENIYLVSFVDEQGWGHRWEVNIDQQIVRFVGNNLYLSRKYGLSRLDRDGKFKITEIEDSSLIIEKKYNNYSRGTSKDIVYIMKGSVLNNTDKILNRAEIIGTLQVIFKDKSLESLMDIKSGFDRKITKSNPWKPNEKLNFYIKTKDVEDIYAQYEPEYVFFNVNILAEDPVGFKYDKVIEEYDLKDEWQGLKK